ncbi:MAG: peptidase G2 autoproteolytic cleavage domain-containing protein [Bacteroidia bacterium]
MKKIVFVVLLIQGTLTINFAQNVGVNSTGATPHASALLDVDAAPTNDKGVLIPRVALLATNNALPITNPATSLLVYNTATAGISPFNVVPGFYYWDGAKWIAMGGSGGLNWSLTGNAGTINGTNFLGTTDGVDLAVYTNNSEKMRVMTTGEIGIANASPQGLLDLGTNNNITFQTAPNSSSYYGIRFKQGVTDAFSLFHDDADTSFNFGYDATVTNSINSHTKYLTLKSTGNVGIGTVIPSNKLSVESAYTDAIKLKGNTSGNAPHTAALFIAESNIDYRGRGMFLPTTAAEASSSWFVGVPYTGSGFQIGVSNTHTQEQVTGPYITSNAKLFITPSGNVGINTSSPACKLDVFSPNTGVAQSNQGGLTFQVQDGQSRPAISTYGNIDGILPNGTGCALAVRQQAGTGRSINASGTINASGADYAEYFYQETPGMLQKGDVVCLAPTGKVTKLLTTGVILGVVSTKPGVVGNDMFDPKNPENTVLVGLVGQVPVNTTTENGEINVGDYLTMSSTKVGYAMKSTDANKVIGVALETLKSGEGKVLAYLNIGEANLISSLKQQKELISSLEAKLDEFELNTKRAIEQLTKDVIEIKTYR